MLIIGFTLKVWIIYIVRVIIIFGYHKINKDDLNASRNLKNVTKLTSKRTARN